MATNSVKSESVKDVFEEFKTQIKGQDSNDCKQICLQLCRNYLSGNWLNVTLDDIQVERLSGGMTNKIYKCKTIYDSEEVVVRLYGDKYDLKTCHPNNRFYDGLVAMIASVENLGPKIFGIFEEGQLLEYYKNRGMEEKDLFDINLMADLASKLAKFHSIEVPVNKSSDWLLKFYFDNLDESLTDKINSMRDSFAEYNCKHLLECDLMSEYQWLSDKIQGFVSPIVFAHNDFRMGNILLTDDNGSLLSDFDYSVYGYRGFDFGSFFFGFETIKENTFRFKDESVVREFIASYVKQSEQIYGKEYSDNECNSVEYILKETKLFAMVYQFFFINAGLVGIFDQAGIFGEKEKWAIINGALANYLAIKSALISENIL